MIPDDIICACDNNKCHGHCRDFNLQKKEGEIFPYCPAARDKASGKSLNQLGKNGGKKEK